MLNASVRSQRILVIDDDPAVLRLVRDKLDHVGYEVLTATSGEHGLDVIAQRGLPHLAIVDILMPGMDGFEFCQTVQQFTDLPVIILTAVEEEEAVIRGIEYFAEDYVPSLSARGNWLLACSESCAASETLPMPLIRWCTWMTI